LDWALRCAPNLAALREGEIVSLFMDKQSKKGPEFLSVVVYGDEEHCVWNHDRPASYDPDRGYVAREPWDVFVLEGRTYVLVVRYDYEMLAMEVFRVDPDRLEPVSRFAFSYLGG
jgi:hypothetical protein